MSVVWAALRRELGDRVVTELRLEVGHPARAIRDRAVIARITAAERLAA